MKKHLLAILLLLISTNSIAANFAALAVDRANGFFYGWAYDNPTLAGAEQRASEECTKKGGNCSVVLSWSGVGCGAYRTINGDVGTAYGWGIARSKTEADGLATKEALKRSNGKDAPNNVYACNSGKKEKLEVIKNEKASAESEKVKVLVKLVMSIRDADLYEADFIGWTYATQSELSQYARKSSYVTYSDEVTGAKKNGTFLYNSKYEDKYMSGALGSPYSTDPNSNPIMTRFIATVVKEHPLYARHAIDEYQKDLAQSYKDDFAYRGAIIVIDGDWTYEKLRASTEYYTDRHGNMSDIGHGGRFAVVDVNEFKPIQQKCIKGDCDNQPTPVKPTAPAEPEKNTIKLTVEKPSSPSTTPEERKKADQSAQAELAKYQEQMKASREKSAQAAKASEQARAKLLQKYICQEKSRKLSDFKPTEEVAKSQALQLAKGNENGFAYLKNISQKILWCKRDDQMGYQCYAEGIYEVKSDNPCSGDTGPSTVQTK